MAGEYGTQTHRPHYHAILFNHDWDDKKYLKTTGSGSKIYTSEYLAKLWGMGHSSTADATFESAAYIARYCLEKRTGEAAKEWYKRQDEEGEYELTPEYNRMSTDPGLGADWLKFRQNDVYTFDQIIINGHPTNTPKYYDKLFKRMDEQTMAQFKEEREWKAYQNRMDNTDDRLRVKEIVAKAKIQLLKRGEI